jgi:hypothetical protein
MDMFVADLREALQSGTVPDITLFNRLVSVYDQRHYDFLPDVLATASTVYRDMVFRYLSFSKQHHGLSDNHIVPMDMLARDTYRQAMAMLETHRIAAQNKNQASAVRLDNSIKFLRDQVIQYKGNPATLTMPLLIIPRVAPGEVASFRDPSTAIIKLEAIAREQLMRAGDRIGSGSPRSNQWLQLVREYRQAVLNRDATLRSFNSTGDYSLDTVSH